MISVILPIYNGEKYLSSCIDSILDQTFKDFELIIINDGSIDATEKIIKNYENKDSRIKSYYKTNSGIVDSLNLGISKAQFDLIARIDADDICHPNRLEKQVALLKEYDIVGSNALLIDKQGNPLGQTNLPKRQEDIEKSIFSMKPSIIHPSIMFRVSNLKLSNDDKVYSSAFMHCEDLELWLRNLDHCKFCNLQSPLIKLRKHDLNISHISFIQQLINTRLLIYTYKNKHLFTRDNQIEEVLDLISNNIQSGYWYRIIKNLELNKFRIFRIILRLTLVRKIDKSINSII